MAEEIDQDPGELLRHASTVSKVAAQACLVGECGGDSGPVGDTADEAFVAAKSALDAVDTEDGAGPLDIEPETRRARLTRAAWYLLLAGTDEHGKSADLDLASWLFGQAADA